MSTSTNINTSVLPNIPKGLYPDHIYHEHPTLMKFIDKNETQDGGLNYAPNRISAKDTAPTWFAGTSLSAAISSASQASTLLNETYNWTNVINAITLTYDDKLRAGSSEFTKITALEAHKKQAKLSHLDALGNYFMNGTGGSQTPYGLAVLVDPTATFGGVVPATDADWTPNTSTAALVFSGLSILQDLFQACLYNGRRPDLIPTTEILFSRAANVCEGGIHYADKGADVARGVDTIKFKGAELYMDRDMPTAGLWMLVKDVIHLFKHTQYFMKMKTPQEPTAGTDIHVSDVGYLLSSFIVAADERRVIGGATNLTF